MKKIFSLFVLALLGLALVGCNDDSIKVESTIIGMEIVDGSYVLYVEYELEGFEEPLTATIYIKSKSEFDKYQLGDKYVFTRPNPSTEKIQR